MSKERDDRIMLKLFIIWLQHQDIYLHKCEWGKAPEIFTKADKLADRFCEEINRRPEE